MKQNRSGWKGESRRHSLARKGIKTANGTFLSKKDANELMNDFGNILSFRSIRALGIDVSPFFEMDLSKYNVPFIVDLHQDPEYNDRRREVTHEIVIMTTDQYLDAIKQGDSRELQVLDFKLNPIKEDMLKGDKFSMPYLEYVWTTGLFYNELKPHFRQEGIHRSIASKELGYEYIPVVVIYPTTVEKFDVVKERMTDDILNSIDLSKVRTYKQRKQEYESKYGENWNY